MIARNMPAPDDFFFGGWTGVFWADPGFEPPPPVEEDPVLGNPKSSPLSLPWSARNTLSL
jgi:hypothetical protein